PDIYNVVHRLQRVCEILKIAVSQISIMETMTPLDFLDFRDLLRPASGFQSIQFKMVEATLGLTYDARFGKGYYLSQLSEADIERVKQSESQKSLLVLINHWLERMPFVSDENYWPNQDFFSQYKSAYDHSLLELEKSNVALFENIFLNKNAYPADRSFSQLASRNALFIMLYRDFPLLTLPYQLLSLLLEVDEHLSMWRQRHIHMVSRTIGKRVGTGGSSGADYLKSAAVSHIIFKELSELTSFL